MNDWRMISLVYDFMYVMINEIKNKGLILAPPNTLWDTIPDTLFIDQR